MNPNDFEISEALDVTAELLDDAVPDASDGDPEETTTPDPPIPSQSNLAKLESDVEEDFESARANYKDLYDQSYSALGIAMDILRGSEHPRAIEVFSGLVNTTANMVEKLLNLHKLKMDMQKGMPQPDLSMLPGANITQNNTQNNITVGSTNDILKALAAMEEQMEEQQ